MSRSYDTGLSKAVLRVSFLGLPLWTIAACLLQRSEQRIVLYVLLYFSPLQPKRNPLVSRALPGHTLSLWFTIYHSGLSAA
jgi:hypothetical protein